MLTAPPSPAVPSDASPPVMATEPPVRALPVALPPTTESVPGFPDAPVDVVPVVAVMADAGVPPAGSSLLIRTPVSPEMTTLPPVELTVNLPELDAVVVPAALEASMVNDDVASIVTTGPDRTMSPSLSMSTMPAGEPPTLSSDTLPLLVPPPPFSVTSPPVRVGLAPPTSVIEPPTEEPVVAAPPVNVTGPPTALPPATVVLAPPTMLRSFTPYPLPVAMVTVPLAVVEDPVPDATVTAPELPAVPLPDPNWMEPVVVPPRDEISAEAKLKSTLPASSISKSPAVPRLRITRPSFPVVPGAPPAI
mmetsp:Transcript_11035/g.38409  ORF Transcript_11035/g.38409 Transcript_11035/m.38409 type:complete len:306 (-) Transcript_11035:2269-3186(-)